MRIIEILDVAISMAERPHDSPCSFNSLAIRRVPYDPFVC